MGVWFDGYKSMWPKDGFGTIGAILPKWHYSKSIQAFRNWLQPLEMLGEPFWEQENDLAISCKVCDVMAFEHNLITVICGCDSTTNVSGPYKGFNTSWALLSKFLAKKYCIKSKCMTESANFSPLPFPTTREDIFQTKYRPNRPIPSSPLSLSFGK